MRAPEPDLDGDELHSMSAAHGHVTPDVPEPDSVAI
jgi:hypothetical protein